MILLVARLLNCGKMDVSLAILSISRLRENHYLIFYRLKLRMFFLSLLFEIFTTRVLTFSIYASLTPFIGQRS